MIDFEVRKYFKIYYNFMYPVIYMTKLGFMLSYFIKQMQDFLFSFSFSVDSNLEVYYSQVQSRPNLYFFVCFLLQENAKM